MELIQNIVYILALIYLILSIGIFIAVAVLVFKGYQTVQEIREKGKEAIDAFVKIKKTQAASAIVVPLVAFVLKKISTSLKSEK
ncbi:hypothetical protein KC726_04385 [Candidatus Woesebacteria bacterium]|nr:hypothetical protein [Candidatus Woesebacteria bacterium]